MKTFASRLGFWSAVVATLLLAVAGPTATASIQPLATVVGFLLTPSFLIVMACIYCYAPEEEGGKVLSQTRSSSRTCPAIHEVAMRSP
jgi:hypothetical protein